MSLQPCFEESIPHFQAWLPPLPTCSPPVPFCLCTAALEWEQEEENQGSSCSLNHNPLWTSLKKKKKKKKHQKKKPNRNIRPRRCTIFLEATSADATKKLSSTVIKRGASAHNFFSLQIEVLFPFGLYSLQGWIATNSDSFVQLVC